MLSPTLVARVALSMKSDGGLGGPKSQDTAPRGARGPASKGAPSKPAPQPFVPTKGTVAPNGIRFK